MRFFKKTCQVCQACYLEGTCDGETFTRNNGTVQVYSNAKKLGILR